MTYGMEIEMQIEFRAYPVGSDGRLQTPRIILADSDGEAIDEVRRLLNGKPIELWEGVRMMGWFQKVGDDVVVIKEEGPHLKRYLVSSAQSQMSPIAVAPQVPELVAASDRMARAS